MSKKNTKARKSYWASIPKEIRSKRMSEIAKKRQEKLTIEDRKKIGKMLLLSRQKA